MATARHIVLALLGTSPLWISIILLLYGPPSYVKFEKFTSSQQQQQQFKNVIHRSPKMSQQYSTSKFWNNANMKNVQVPTDIQNGAKLIRIQEKTIKLNNVGLEIFCREALTEGSSNPHLSILLLHGRMFSSKTWQELGTLQILAAMGYKTIAVDIPGYGNSPEKAIPSDFIEQLVKELSLIRPVIISPSLSGYYTIPYLISNWKEMGGFVPVAPVGWERLQKEKPVASREEGNVSNVPDHLKATLPDVIPDLNSFKVPTLVVYGEHDRTRSSALLCLLPWSQGFEIPDGKHPAYLDNPELWHQLLFNFLGYVTGSIAETNSQ